MSLVGDLIDRLRTDGRFTDVCGLRAFHGLPPADAEVASPFVTINASVIDMFDDLSCDTTTGPRKSLVTIACVNEDAGGAFAAQEAVEKVLGGGMIQEQIGGTLVHSLVKAADDDLVGMPAELGPTPTDAITIRLICIHEPT